MTLIKFNLLLLTMISFGIISFGQNTLPVNGNVGIGTTVPACELEVHGNTDLDGKVVMRDSVKVDGELLIEQNVVIKGSTKNLGDFYVGNNFILPSLAATALVQEDLILMVKGDGTVGAMEKGLLSLYEPKLCVVDVNGDYFAPVWSNIQGVSGAPGVLYTADNCPGNVGIGTSSPLGKLDVRGSTYIGSGHTATGAMLSVNQNAPNKNGLDVFLTSASSTISGIGINTVVNKNNRIAYNVYNELTQTNMFSVYGDGRISLHEQVDQNASIEVTNINGNSVFQVLGNGNVFLKNKAKLVFDGSQPVWNS